MFDMTRSVTRTHAPEKPKPRARLQGVILPTLAAAGLAFALYSVLYKPVQAARTPEIAPPAAPAEGAVAGIGIVEPQSEFINVGVELPGIVREVYVSVGDEVAKGQPMFALDQREVDADIQTLRASLRTAEVAAADALASYGLVSKVDDPRAISRDEVDRRRFAAELAEAKASELRAQLTAAQTRKARLTVTAPISGRVLELNARPGEFAVAGALLSPLAVIGDLSRLHVRVEVDEENMARLQSAGAAFGTMRGAASQRVPLTFVRYEPYVKPKQNLAVAGQRVDTRVVQVIYALPQGAKADFVGQQLDVFMTPKSTGFDK